MIASAPGAKRRAHGDLTGARGRPREQQIGDVGAAQQQHEAHHAQQEHRRRRQIAPDDAGADRFDDHAGALVLFRIREREPIGNDAQLGLRRLDRHAGLQARDHVEGAGGAHRGDVRDLARQRPDLGRPGKLHVLGDDANHGVGLTVQAHETADNRGVAAESAAPHGFAEQHHARRRALVFGLERAAHNRDDLEDVEEVGAGALTLCRLDRTVRSGQQRAAAHASLHEGDALERPALQVPVAHVQRRDAGLGRRRRALPQHHQPIGLAERQRPHQRRIGQRENGAVDADAERQGEPDHHREPRR